MLLKQGKGNEERAMGSGKRKMGTKAYLNPNPIRNFISNSLLNLFPFLKFVFRFPILRAQSLRLVPHFSNIDPFHC